MLLTSPGSTHQRCNPMRSAMSDSEGRVDELTRDGVAVCVMIADRCDALAAWLPKAVPPISAASPMEQIFSILCAAD